MKKLITMFSLLFSLAANAAVVYSHPPAGSGMLSSAWWTPNGSDYDQYTWDNFSLSNSAPVAEVKWRGGFAYSNGPGSVAGFTIKFYSLLADNSQPDLISYYTANPLATYTVSGNPGQSSAGGAMYDYDFVLPAPFQAVAARSIGFKSRPRKQVLPTGAALAAPAAMPGFSGSMPTWVTSFSPTPLVMPRSHC